MAKTKERIEEIKQRVQNVAQTIIGLHLFFRPTKGVSNPGGVVRTMRDMTAPLSDAYRVEVVSPTGFGLDVGHVAFDAESGNMFAVGDPSYTIGVLLDKMDPKDRY